MNENYIKQVETMHANGLAWRRANPDRKVLVQFNFPDRVWISAPISLAIACKLVCANEAGIELVDALWPHTTDADEPTVMMVRCALEAGK